MSPIEFADNEIWVSDSDIHKEVENGNLQLVGGIRVYLIVCLQYQETLIVCALGAGRCGIA